MLQNEDQQEASEVSQVEATVNGHHSQEGTSQYRYYINIGTAESFEEKLVQAQKEMGRNLHDYVQVTYISEIDWISELIKCVPVFLLMASIIYVGRCLKYGTEGVNHNKIKETLVNSVMGMRKAPITKLNRESQDKVLSLDLFFIYD